jgi:hypothetical protein
MSILARAACIYRGLQAVLAENLAGTGGGSPKVVSCGTRGSFIAISTHALGFLRGLHEKPGDRRPALLDKDRRFMD